LSESAPALLFHGAARSSGLNHREASGLTITGSAWSEITDETHGALGAEGPQRRALRHVHGRHAIGAKYVWSHRSASCPVVGDRNQTFDGVGIFYTLLGGDGFGAVDWRQASH
jgi:hypothetical protein